MDLRLVRNQWILIDPKVEFLMSETNEDKTTGDFREMGHRLAQEVISFIKIKMDKISKYGKLEDIKLSFVGHSMGNLIIRTAIAGNLVITVEEMLFVSDQLKFDSHSIVSRAPDLTFDCM